MLSRRSKADAQNNFSKEPPGNTSQPCPDDGPDDDRLTSSQEGTETHWVEIELVGEDDEPIPGETYRVSLSDGTLVKEDSLDMNGKARVEGIAGEKCLVSFPKLDDESWELV